MTPELQRIAIAEACPHLFVVDGGGQLRHPEKLTGFDPLTNLDATHAMEEWLFSHPTYDYERRYALMVSSVVSLFGQAFEEVLPDGLSDVAACIHATATQRVEAFLRTLDLWKE
jgi:hypothetical protein